MSIEDRALEGIFMSFQYPISIPGLNTMHFLRTSVNSIRKHQNKKEYTSGEFIKLFKEKLKVVGLDESVNKLRNDYYNQTRAYMAGVFGDYQSPNYSTPVWKAPEAPGAIGDDDDDE